jgi:hypothetical protein
MLVDAAWVGVPVGLPLVGPPDLQPFRFLGKEVPLCMRVRKTPNVVATISLCLLLLAVLAAGCRTSGPAVVSTQPAAGATAVPVSPAVVRITFDQPMVRSTVESAFSISPAVGTERPEFAWTDDNRVVVVTFPQNLQPNTQYTFTLGTSAQASNAVTLASPVQVAFTTAPSAVAGEAAEPAAPPAETPPAATPPAETPAAPAVTFEKNIMPIARDSCDGCHAGMASGRMADYDNIISKNYVVPNEPDNSSYYRKGSGLVTHGGGDAWKANKQLVRDWIARGAPK